MLTRGPQLAQRGAQDDCTKFTVADGGGSSNGGTSGAATGSGNTSGASTGSGNTSGAASGSSSSNGGTSSNGDAAASLTLDANAVQTGSQSDGQAVLDAGQSPSAT